MNISELNFKLTNSLKDYIRNNGYVESGKLINSIEFKCTYTDKLNINFDAENYIKYLDDGQLISKWLKLNLNIISEFIKDDIVDEIKKGI